MQKIILASTSVYRREQLSRLHVDFEALPPNVDEDAVKTQGLNHTELSRELSLLKARAISTQHNEAIVIGGDQVASFGDEILSKPKTPENAFTQLKKLSGNTHQLITSLAMIHRGNEYVHTAIATMHMRELSDEQIRRYIDIDEPLHSCGSYRLEALGISLFEKIECDDYTGIIGIPLMWTSKTLSQLGVEIP